MLCAHPGVGAITLALLFGLFNLAYGTWALVHGIELRRTRKTLHSAVRETEPAHVKPSLAHTHPGGRLPVKSAEDGTRHRAREGVLMGRTWRWLLAVALPLVLAACTSSGSGVGDGVTGSGPAAVAVLRTIRHVWVIDLENQGYAQTFGNPSADPYLAATLPRMGALLENYYAIGHNSARQLHRPGLRPGAGPGRRRTTAVWTRVPRRRRGPPYHQLVGERLRYPATVPTLGNQLAGAG